MNPIHGWPVLVLGALLAILGAAAIVQSVRVQELRPAMFGALFAAVGLACIRYGWQLIRRVPEQHQGHGFPVITAERPGDENKNH